MEFAERITIGDKTIGGNITFIIAEIGSNHNQDITKAYELIDAAVESGADAVKFQSIKTDKLFIEKGMDKDTKELFKKIELKEEWYRKISDYCLRKHTIFFSTPTYFEAIDLLIENNVKLMKIASPQTYGFPELIKRIGQTKLPTIMSTGYCNYKHIERAVNVFEQTGNRKLILLHCSANYPTVVKQVDLNFIPTLKSMFGTIVGFSDHTYGYHIPVAAVAKGAQVIEKHFTLSRKDEGPDHFFAIEPEEFKMMVNNIRDVEAALGSQRKNQLTDFEISFRNEVEMKICAFKDIQEGEAISKNKIIYFRNNERKGISSWQEHKVIGKKAKTNISKNTFIEFTDIY